MRSFDQFLHESNKTFTTGGDPGNRRVTGATDTDEKKYAKPDQKARDRRRAKTIGDKKRDDEARKREASKPNLEDQKARLASARREDAE